MKRLFIFPQTFNANVLILGVALFFLLFGNQAFVANIVSVYPLTLENSPFLFSLALLFFGVNVVLLSLLCIHRAIKPVLIVLLLVSSFTSYFMDSYNVVIDASMIQNVLHTDLNESLDLFSLKLVLYVGLLGILPAWLVYKIKLPSTTLSADLFSRLKLFSLTLLLMLAVVFSFSDAYASFFREQKSLRYYSNPSYYLYSISKVVNNQFKVQQVVAAPLGEDAITPEDDKDRELVIMVVGETARADRFSLNGYTRETNPLLAKEQVYSFSNFWSCGTSTAISVPCMFSLYGEDDFNNEKGSATENVLDVLQHAGVNVLWLDNNSDSKGVAIRGEYQSYKSSETNPICDVECRDEGMLAGVAEYISAHPSGDILIVLHQMGNHGPAYYKRYPERFERFTPVCKTNQLAECSGEQIGNAYDNAILYTDYFLSKTIELLKGYDEDYETAMLYVSDHGESLGENGLYLHGLPNLFAPEQQRHVPAILWVGSHYDEINKELLPGKLANHYSHDYLFHTLLGMMEIESQTPLYQLEMDFIKGPS